MVVRTTYQSFLNDQLQNSNNNDFKSFPLYSNPSNTTQYNKKLNTAMDNAARSQIQALPGNHTCVDCGESSPSWASVKFGVMFCLECSGAHRGLGVQVDFVRSVTLDNWTKDQIEIMKAGGNSKFQNYLKEHGVVDASRETIKDAYTSQAATHYKEILAAVAKGEPAPVSQKMGNKKVDGGDKNTISDMESIMDSVKTEPTLLYSQAFVAVSKFFWKRMNPTVISLGYSFLGGIFYCTYPSNSTAVWVSTLVVGVLPPIGLLTLTLSVAKKFLVHRQPPFKSAQNLLIDQIMQGRAKRTSKYDIFLPPATEKVKHGMIFFPGALVSHTAYAPFAFQLSEQGILVVVMSLEPERFLDNVEIGKRRVLNAMYDVLSNHEVIVAEWVLGGHSAGGLLAVELAAEMKPGIRNLVLSGVSLRFLGPLRGGSETNILLINGSKDLIIQEKGKKDRTDLLKEIKGTTKCVIIQGGNHSGIAHYGPQIYPKPDGIRSITMDEQQQQTVRTIVEFLSALDDETRQKVGLMNQ